MVIQPIVEGHGDVAAFPVLLRRLVEEAQAWEVGIGRPIRRRRNQLVQKAEVELAVRLALLQPDCGGVLILFDGDSDCPAELGPTVQDWATGAARGCALWNRHRAPGVRGLVSGCNRIVARLSRDQGRRGTPSGPGRTS